MNEVIRQAQVMQRKLAAAQEEMKNKTVETTAGGGMVTVVCTGDQKLKEINIDPTLLEGGDVEMIQDLIFTAVNDALTKSNDMMEKEMSKISGGLRLPGLF
ncbi:MAG: YbaB/EbfC family nucleoid-associated protein [Desulfovibrio sp.]